MPKFYGYYSYDYGIKITVQNEESNKKIEIPLLRSEFEDFNRYVNENKIKTLMKDKYELDQTYIDYFSHNLSKHDFTKEEIQKIIKKEELKNLIPTRVSFQIYCYKETKKQFENDFIEFNEESS